MSLSVPAFAWGRVSGGGGNISLVGAVSLDLARQAHRVFVYTLMVSTFHSGSERNRGFSETIPKFVRGCQRPRPTLLRLRIEQIELTLLVVETRGVNAQQPDLGTLLPIVPEKLADLREDLVIELRTAGG